MIIRYQDSECHWDHLHSRPSAPKRLKYGDAQLSAKVRTAKHLRRYDCHLAPMLPKTRCTPTAVCADAWLSITRNSYRNHSCFSDSRMRLRSCKAVKHPAVGCTYLQANFSKKSEAVHRDFYVPDLTLLLYRRRETNNRAALVLTTGPESRDRQPPAELDVGR